MHDLQERVHELNKAASLVAREVADKNGGLFVFGDVGPSGELLEPIGAMSIDEATEIFAEQIRGLVDGGADAILVETMSDLNEVRAAVNAAHSVAPDIPVAVTLSFDTNLRTMMGVKPSTAIKEIAEMGVRLIGANCGRGTDEMLIIGQELVDNKPEGVHILLTSNAGLPQLVGGEFVYTGTADEYAQYVATLHAAGVNAFGACCGSRPEHIAAIARTLA
jgi:5-methyltetrahydrofolate--homocysteine methyltransferase